MSRVIGHDIKEVPCRSNRAVVSQWPWTRNIGFLFIHVWLDCQHIQIQIVEDYKVFKWPTGILFGVDEWECVIVNYYYFFFALRSHISEMITLSTWYSTIMQLNFASVLLQHSVFVSWNVWSRESIIMRYVIINACMNKQLKYFIDTVRFQLIN